MRLEVDMWALSAFPLLKLAPVQQHTEAPVQSSHAKRFAFIFILQGRIYSSLKMRYIISTKPK